MQGHMHIWIKKIGLDSNISKYVCVRKRTCPTYKKIGQKFILPTGHSILGTSTVSYKLFSKLYWRAHQNKLKIAYRHVISRFHNLTQMIRLVDKCKSIQTRRDCLNLVGGLEGLVLRGRKWFLIAVKSLFLILDLNVSGSSEIIVGCVFVEVCFWWDF